LWTRRTSWWAACSSRRSPWRSKSEHAGRGESYSNPRRKCNGKSLHILSGLSFVCIAQICRNKYQLILNT
jgi:hypothetical protein